MKPIITAEIIERNIYLIRGQKVMLDRDLAVLYAVETFNLNKAVKRNIDRFPSDFMFQITKDEAECLIFQFGISKTNSRGGRRYLPYAFTEQGVAMRRVTKRNTSVDYRTRLIILSGARLCTTQGNDEKTILAEGPYQCFRSMNF